MLFVHLEWRRQQLKPIGVNFHDFVDLAVKEFYKIIPWWLDSDVDAIQKCEEWKEENRELTREESILVGFLLTDICVLDKDSKMMEDLKTIYNQMVTKHKPDFAYLQEFGQKHLLEGGHVEPNPHYMQTVEQMFTIDRVLTDAEQVRMINTGEMPIYDEVKVCPYCGKQFGDDVELLFKHVKTEHDKK